MKRSNLLSLPLQLVLPGTGLSGLLSLPLFIDKENWAKKLCYKFSFIATVKLQNDGVIFLSNIWKTFSNEMNHRRMDIFFVLTFFNVLASRPKTFSSSLTLLQKNHLNLVQYLRLRPVPCIINMLWEIMTRGMGETPFSLPVCSREQSWAKNFILRFVSILYRSRKIFSVQVKNGWDYWWGMTLNET